MNYRQWIARCIAEAVLENTAGKALKREAARQSLHTLFGKHHAWADRLTDELAAIGRFGPGGWTVDQLSRKVLSSRHFYPFDPAAEKPQIRRLRPVPAQPIAAGSTVIRRQLPRLDSVGDLQAWLGVESADLDWLSQRYRASASPRARNHHYLYHRIAKADGRPRLLEAPKPLLKHIQRRIYTQILQPLPAHPCAHGISGGGSCVDHAKAHVGQALILAFDLKDFFTSVTYRRVFRLFRLLGYPAAVTRYLSRLTTHATPAGITRQNPDLNRDLYAIPHLPQGAPTSPALANQAALRLDHRLCALASKMGWRYSRYCDDFAFSGPGISKRAAGKLRTLVDAIVIEENFIPNYRKFRLLPASQSQRLTGVVVNEKANIARREYDQLKAILCNCVRHGAASQNRDKHADFAAHLRGRIAYIRQLNPARADKLYRLYRDIDWVQRERPAD